jgi:hypothetical protein
LVALEIPRPAGENAGLRDDPEVSGGAVIFKLTRYLTANLFAAYRLGGYDP